MGILPETKKLVNLDYWKFSEKKQDKSDFSRSQKFSIWVFGLNTKSPLVFEGWLLRTALEGNSLEIKTLCTIKWPNKMPQNQGFVYMYLPSSWLIYRSHIVSIYVKPPLNKPRKEILMSFTWKKRIEKTTRRDNDNDISDVSFFHCSFILSFYVYFWQLATCHFKTLFTQFDSQSFDAMKRAL